MDNHKEVHKIIRKFFPVKNPEDGLPFLSGMRYHRDLFPKMFKALNFNIGAELGVRKGSFSAKLCLENKDLKLYCIDPWMPYSESKDGAVKYTKEVQDSIFEEAKKRLSSYNVTFIRKTSLDALADIKERELDFIYIDGNHLFDYVCLDIIGWASRVRSGGIIACHDYHRVGVAEAIRAYTRAHHIDPWYVTKEVQPTAYWVNL